MVTYVPARFSKTPIQSSHGGDTGPPFGGLRAAVAELPIRSPPIAIACGYWQPGNLNEAIHVLQLGAAPVLSMYSVVYQKVQSSAGSIDIAL